MAEVPEDDSNICDGLIAHPTVIRRRLAVAVAEEDALRKLLKVANFIWTERERLRKLADERRGG